MILAYDIFLSYKSEDTTWVNKLKDSLQERGVKVWMDKTAIRPGDLFEYALEAGIDSSRTVGLVITPESLNSSWVQMEYQRALNLSKKRQLTLLPILLKDAVLPDLLSELEYIDFRDETSYEKSVDKLIWPGITGRKVAFLAMNSMGAVPWVNLSAIIREQGIELRASDYVETAKREMEKYFSLGYRVVIIADIFEGWPWADWAGRTAAIYADHIFEIRSMTRETEKEVVFLLYQNENALRTHLGDLDEITARRLQHYFSIPMRFEDKYHAEKLDPVDAAYRMLKTDFHHAWIRAQRELLR